MGANNETETFTIGIDSNLAAVKEELDKARGALKVFQDAANEKLFAGDQFAKARHDVKELDAAFRELAKAKKDSETEQKQSASAAAKEIKEAAREQKKAAADAAKEQAKSYADADSKRQKAEAQAAADAKDSAGLLSAAGDAVAKGASVALDYAKQALGYIKEGVEYGIQKSDAKRHQTRVFDKVTESFGGDNPAGVAQGKIAYKVTMDLAGETGIDPATAKRRVTQLINAGFGRKDTELLFHAAADIGEIREGGSEKFLQALEKTSLRGKATERDLKAMAGAGVNVQMALKQLAKDGESVASVEARLKAGKVAAIDFARAAATVTEKRIGGLAGHDLASEIQRIKIGVGGLFSDMDITPLDELAAKLSDAFKGDAGASLKKSITEAGSSIIALTKNISAADIAGAFNAAAGAARTMAEGIGDAVRLARDLKKLTTVGSNEETGSVKFGADSALGGGKSEAQIDAVIARAKAAKALGGDAANHGYATSRTNEGFEDTGKAIATGMAKGVTDNAGLVAGAVAGMAKGGVAAGNKAIGARSPAVEGIKTGGYYGEGVEIGVRGRMPHVGAAAAGLGAQMVRAGRGGFAGGAGGGNAGQGGGGSQSFTFNMPTTLHVEGGGRDAAAMANEILNLLAPRLQAQQRAVARIIARDAQESRG